MKILYGVQGTGNGHITRARALNEEFARLGMDVDYLFSGRNKDDYFDMACFGDYRVFEGLSFVAIDGRISLLSSYRKANIMGLIRDIRALDLSDYDLVITDFEPISAWAAKRQNIPCIGIGHQYALGYDIPKYQGDAVGSWILSRFAPVPRSIGVHWHHFDQPILPPIIQRHNDVTKPQDDHVLVYLPFENSEEVMEWLERVPNYKFRVHCKDIEPGCYGNIKVFPFSRDQFQQNLKECESVLCNAGFELNSEALQMGRRILVKPLHGQVEQLSNMIALEQLGFAQGSKELSAEVINQWLESSKVVKVDYPDVAKAIAEWIAAGAEEPIEQLSQRLWDCVPLANGIQFQRAEAQYSIAS
ncbi:glycosyltransferase [Marinomonas piezotolerans]|uniref:Glycosyltransferase n=1 Tax=Marinomonas piezotolerans TaxID=2213058 RepID=A0A370U5L9_9GAMM|nr:MJ1255/VC2487 family glycosyltransferase [Marinomonas piezotolerans]RDL43076.1 glycosyltransferase [Marinomonas piezotolerans]